MEDVLVQLEGGVEQGPDLVLKLVDNLASLLVDEVFEAELVLLESHLLRVVAVPEARVAPHNVHLLASHRNSSSSPEHLQEVIDVDGQVIPFILTDLWLVGEEQELLVAWNPYHDSHIAASPWDHICAENLLVLFSNARKSTSILHPVFHTPHTKPNRPTSWQRGGGRFWQGEPRTNQVLPGYSLHPELVVEEASELNHT